MVDALFAEPLLARVYDPLDPDRGDLDAYVAIVDELGARSVLDVGCGTGTFAVLLAERGIDVTGVDPAAASLDVARGKDPAGLVRWVHGEVDDLPPLQVDLATMTANVAQVFLTDEHWATTLEAVHARLRPGGHLVFETRRPEREAWREWDRDSTRARAEVPGIGRVESWVQVTSASQELVSFRTTFVFQADDDVRTSYSTLRFRDRRTVDRSLRAAGFAVVDVREAPDRPGRELVFIARRAEGGAR
jgi:SAM-dependent methyltransferase